MNFAVFSAQYLPTVGGVERYTNSLAKQLIKKGHTVTVITCSVEGQPNRQTDADGIDIVRLPSFWMMNHRFPVPYGGLSKAAEILKQKKIDYALVQTRFYLTSLWAARLCKKIGIPFAVLEHGTAYLINSGILGLLGKSYEHMAASYIKGKTDNFYGVSLRCCNWLKNFGIQAKGCLYNAVDPAVLQERAAAGEEKIKSEITFENRFNICFVGRFIKEKGVNQLSEAFERFKQKYPHRQLVMAGNGPIWGQIKDKNIPGIILTGNISYEESLALIKNSDVFCLPTFSEGFATAVLEAAGLKTAIITTATGGSPRLIKNEDYGIIIPNMEKESILKALEDMISQPEKIKTRARAAYENLIENFTWEKVSRDFMNICKKEEI